MTFTHFIIIKVVRRGDFYATRAEFDIHIAVCYDRDATSG